MQTRHFVTIFLFDYPRNYVSYINKGISITIKQKMISQLFYMLISHILPQP